jgi:hypothetical protein
MVAETAQRSDYLSLSPRALIEAGIETVRFGEVVPLEKVLTDASIIDVTHARELGHSMSQRRGQLSPIVVRARVDTTTNNIIYDVIDGFHRTEGKRLNGDTEINATVVYGCSDEELFDLRILAASSVRSIQFARVAQWIASAYASTPWRKKGLSVAQAFAVAAYDSAKSKFIDLDEEEIAAIKAWAREKSEKWGKTQSAIYFTLKVVENADPDLVRQVRTSGGGRDRVGRITPDRLTVVANTFPGQENYVLQRAILRVVVEQRLTSGQTEQLTRAAKSFVGPGMTESEVYEIVSRIELIDKRVISTAAEDQEDDLSDELPNDKKEPTEEELGAIEMRSVIHPRKVSHLRGEAIYTDAGPREERLADFASGEEDTIEGLRLKIEDLESALEAANRDGGGKVDSWWRTAAYLTPLERTIFERVIFANEPLDEVCQRYGFTKLQVIRYIISCFNKREISESRRESQL